ncbi:unnamed protein product [Rotaria sordida]|uniref:Uncharacterized protein n=1 Tax=Rotaria sordida TaxID=392033 RepID=A0A813YCZ5_9BILA|nr:unnamed protein product [Rotaria sordida]CAF1571147.1 unnamed protein product [Rotaria sordida]
MVSDTSAITTSDANTTTTPNKTEKKIRPLKIPYFDMTPAAEHITKYNSITLLFMLIVVLLMVYGALILFVWGEAAPFLQGKFAGTTFDNSIDLQLKEVIRTIAKDYYNCYYCVNNFTSFTAIQNLINTQENNSMRPQPLDYLLSQNKWLLLIICLMLIFIYYWIFSIFISMMKNIHSKHDYFNEHLKKEREKLNTLEQKIYELKQIAGHNLDMYDIVCHKCWSSIYNLNFDYVISHALENNKPIKKSYDDTLSPLQYVFIITCFINTISITLIFKEPVRLFLLSNLFIIISLCIHGEFFISNVPDVYYTLINGILIFLFSAFVLLKILMTLLTIVHYRIMKNILTSE